MAVRQADLVRPFESVIVPLCHMSLSFFFKGFLAGCLIFVSPEDFDASIADVADEDPDCHENRSFRCKSRYTGVSYRSLPGVVVIIDVF